MIRILVELTKLRISAFSTLSAATGYVVFARRLHWHVLTSCLGVLLVAMGACALNEWQDREIDARMERTRGRPLPAGLIAPATALAVAISLIIAGSLVLGLIHGAAPCLLGLLAVLWYNGLYTYLKRLSAFAVVPGAFIGAMPPAIGWTAAGGQATSLPILALCAFFFIWQIPHFWLLLFAFGNDYERAGLPSLTSTFTRGQLARLTLLWTLVTVGTSLLLRIYGVVASPWTAMGLVAAGIWLAYRAAALLRGGAEDRARLRGAFAGINVYALVVMGLLALDSLLFVHL